MYAQIEKPKENKSRAVANSVAQKKSNGKQGFGFVDNCAEKIECNKVQKLANYSTSLPTQKKKNITGLQRASNAKVIKSAVQLWKKDGANWVMPNDEETKNDVMQEFNFNLRNGDGVTVELVKVAVIERMEKFFSMGGQPSNEIYGAEVYGGLVDERLLEEVALDAGIKFELGDERELGWSNKEFKSSFLSGVMKKINRILDSKPQNYLKPNKQVIKSAGHKDISSKIMDGNVPGRKYEGQKFALKGTGQHKLSSSDFEEIVELIELDWLSSISESTKVIRHDWQNITAKGAKYRNYQIQWGGSAVTIGAGKGDSSMSAVLVSEQLLNAGHPDLIAEVKKAHKLSYKEKKIVQLD